MPRDRRSLRRCGRGFRRHGAVGVAGAAPDADGRAGGALAGQSRHLGGRRVVVRLLGPATVVGVALDAAGHGWGLFHLLDLPLLGRVGLGVIALDLSIYAQHVVFHHVPWLWRLHRMHHADLDIDVTTGCALSSARDPDFARHQDGGGRGARRAAGRGVVFEVLLNATSMFNHSNVSASAAARPIARWMRGDAANAPRASLDRARGNRQQFRIQSAVVGSPVRHLSREPHAGEAGLVIGLPIFRDVAELRVDRMLTQPFRNATEFSASRRRPRSKPRSAAESPAAITANSVP